MSLWRQLRHGMRSLIAGGRVDREVDEEIQHFIDESAAALERDGLSPDHAARMARLGAGNTLAAREEVRAAGWEHLVETTLADVRYGCRRLWKAPAFTVTAVLTLTLGIGVTTAMVGAARPILFDTLPYPSAERIVVIWDRAPQTPRLEVTFGSFLEIEARSRTMHSVAVMRPWQPSLTGRFEPERLNGQRVSAKYFELLGIGPWMGSPFIEADDRPNAAPVAIISHRLWQRRFNADPSIVGAVIETVNARLPQDLKFTCLHLPAFHGAIFVRASHELTVGAEGDNRRTLRRSRQ